MTLDLLREQKNHEEYSVVLAKNFLKNKYSEQQIATIQRLILATKIGHNPIDHLECIIQDADCSHLASNNFNQISDLLKEELRLTNAGDYSDLDWKKENITFLTKHQFYTNYAIENWKENKHINLLNSFKSVKKL
jgi:predicted metal-dependent HD superfamily phosphohydrolase